MFTMPPERITGTDLVLRGVAILGGPCGPIYVSEDLIAQRGESFVRDMVRRQFEAAHNAHRAAQRAQAQEN